MFDKEYIEREALLKKIENRMTRVANTIRDDSEAYDIYMMAKNHAVDCVKSTTAADAEEVRHGTWKNVITGYCCSECNAHEPTKRFLYCPTCGAKMD